MMKQQGGGKVVVYIQQTQQEMEATVKEEPSQEEQDHPYDEERDPLYIGPESDEGTRVKSEMEERLNPEVAALEVFSEKIQSCDGLHPFIIEEIEIKKEEEYLEEAEVKEEVADPKAKEVRRNTRRRKKRSPSSHHFPEAARKTKKFQAEMEKRHQDETSDSLEEYAEHSSDTDETPQSQASATPPSLLPVAADSTASTSDLQLIPTPRKLTKRHSDQSNLKDFVITTSGKIQSCDGLHPFIIEEIEIKKEEEYLEEVEVKEEVEDSKAKEVRRNTRRRKKRSPSSHHFPEAARKTKKFQAEMEKRHQDKTSDSLEKWHIGMPSSNKRKWTDLDMEKALEAVSKGDSIQSARDMACSKRRKFDDENRSFKEEWIEQYAFILPTASSKPLCLICSETIALVKNSNMKCHYETKHSGFKKKYQQGTEERKNKINRLKSQYERSTIVLANTMTVQERATECSLRIVWILGKHKKPFTDAEVVKECMLETAETLFDDKQKNEIKDKIKQIPLSDFTAMRTELLADDLMSQLDEGLKKAPCISLAIDESTDSTDNAQLMVFVRYYDAGKKEFCQDLLGVTDLKGRTRGEDIYGALKSMLESRNIDVKSIISLTTDGAPSMVGRGRGLVARLKEDNPDMITYHCIIHQSVLCASLGDEYCEVMETIMKLVNFLQSTSALQHRLLRSFLTEVSASYDDLLVHNNVRWLSKGRVLE